MKNTLFLIIPLLLAGFTVGCRQIDRIVLAQPATATPAITPTFAPTPAPTAIVPAPTPTPTTIIPDTGWMQIQPNLERRIINVVDTTGKQIEQIYLLRINPTAYQFSIAYHPTEPKTLPDWQAETGALIVVNGGYFREEDGKYIPTGLTIVNGQTIGRSYDTFAGMLAIANSGPELRWLEQEPVDPGEPLVAGLQSFPILVKPGGQLGFPEQYEDNKKARRTVIAQDKDGRMLFIVTAKGYFTLHQLSKYLVDSDLELDMALNLDGGKSSGILLNDPFETIPALSLLPIVITIESNEVEIK